MRSNATGERLQPIPVAPPSRNQLLFKARCWFDLQLATIASALQAHLRDLQGNVLDVGAGESPWRDWLPASCSYQGLDVESSGEYGMRPAKEDVIYYDGKNMPIADSSFDGAFCIEVLEHVPDPEWLLSEIARVLKSGAPLLLTVPFSARRHHIPHDYHRFTRERLHQLLVKSGFIEIDIQERGNDIAVIASKIIVVIMRLAREFSLTRPLSALALLMLLPVGAAFLTAAHLAIHFDLGSKEDPLGYFVKAIRHHE